MKPSVKSVLIGAVILTVIAAVLHGSPLVISSGTWQATGVLSNARSGAAASLLSDGRILVTGGNSTAGSLASADFFNADGSITAAPPMVYSRAGQVSVTLQDGRVLVAGGVTAGGSTTSTAEIFDPLANSWSMAAGAMTEARAGATAAVLQDGRVVLAGGQNGSTISSTVEIFDPTTGAFTSVGMMSSPRTQHAMTVLHDGRALIVGGFNGSGPVATTDIFDPAVGTISAGPALSVARFSHSATTLLNGVVAVIGGNNGNADPQQADAAPTEIFDPSSAAPAFSTIAAMPATPREGHAAILLPNNNSILIMGGTSAGATVASAELFTAQDSAAGIWSYGFTSTGAMSVARSNVSAAANQSNAPSTTMQRRGVLMVAGGSDANGNALNTTEAYGYPLVQTDLGDYPPGSVVTITGSGFQPGETVTIQLIESPLLDTHGPYTAVADANGNFLDTDFVTDPYDLNIRFFLTATGAASGLIAQNTFTDATATNTTLSSNPNPSNLNQSVTLTATVRNGNVQGSGALVTVGSVTFFDQTGINNPNCSGNTGANLGNSAVSGSGTATISHSFTVSGARKLGACYNGTGGQGTQNSQSPSITQTVNSDATPPVVTITFPAPVHGTNGWFNAQDTVPVVGSVSATDSSNVSSISCSDSAGGLAQGALSGGGTTTATASLTVSGDGTHNISCTATDGAGNNGAAAGSTAMPVVVKIDTQAPTGVTGAATRPADHNGWFTSAVMINFSGNDPTSGISSCTSTNYSGPDSASASVSGHCTDNAGNQSSDVPFNFKYDATAPTAVSLSVTAGTAGTNGWYTSDVTVHTSGTELVSLPLSCTPDQFQTAETTGQVFNGSCTNDAGLTTNAAALTIKLDKTGPTATLNATGTFGNNGWYTSNVTISTTGSDTISNPTTCTADQTQTTDTTGQTFNGSCTNDAGLKTDATPLTIKRDATPPTVIITPDRSADHNGWYNHALTFTNPGTDATSGIASCTVPATYTAPDTATASVSADCTDNAGNVGHGSFGFKFDATAPANVTVSADRTPDSNGWYNHAITVTWTGTDPVSGIDTCTKTPYSGPDNGSASLSGSCTDVAGNTSTSVAFNFKYDATPPTVAITPDRSADHNGWYNHALTFTNPGTDATSGIASCTVPATYTAPDTATASVSADCTDNAGNVGHGSFNFKFDATAPTNVTVSADRTPDSNGWYNHALTVTWNGTDATSGIDSCTKTPYGGPDNGGASLPGTCTDVAGNTSSSVAFNFKYDATPPVLTLAFTPDTPDGMNGWWKTPGGVPFAWTCSDATSGIDGTYSGGCPTPLSGTVTTNGTTTFDLQVRDEAGNLSVHVTRTLKLDNVAPTITWNSAGDSCSLPGNAGWCRGTETAAFTASDTTSGLANLAQASFPQSTGTNGTAILIASGSVMDQAGNVASSINAGPYKIDSIAPTISLTAPGNGQVYVLNAAIPANYSCNDATSGVATCSGPVPSGTDFSTTSLGSHSFTVTATDEAGNTATPVINTYSIQFGTCLLYDPTRSVKSGATYPLKLYLCDANNNDVSSPAIVVHAASIYMVSGFSGAPEDSGNANPDSDFRFDPTLGPSGGYIFNLQTKGLSGGTYGYTFTATGDSQTHPILPGFGVK